MDSTHLQFLTRDGAILATFEPALNAEQAEELAELVADRESTNDLATLIEAFADHKRLRLTLDRV